MGPEVLICIFMNPVLFIRILRVECVRMQEVLFCSVVNMRETLEMYDLCV